MATNSATENFCAGSTKLNADGRAGPPSGSVRSLVADCMNSIASRGWCPPGELAEQPRQGRREAAELPQAPVVLLHLSSCLDESTVFLPCASYSCPTARRVPTMTTNVTRVAPRCDAPRMVSLDQDAAESTRKETRWLARAAAQHSA